MFRHELKFYINHFEYHNLRVRLLKALPMDHNSCDDNGYHIRSLYFDDVSNSALFQKQSGVISRKKYRIRTYNLDSDFIKLEIKQRVGQFIHKKSIVINKDDYSSIINKDWDSLKKMSMKYKDFSYFFLKIRQGVLRPNVIVDYIREAYVSNINNIRITFDKELSSGLNNIDLLDKSIPTIKALDEPWMILEIKYDNFLPDHIKNILQMSSNTRYAISKFAICKKFIKKNHWEDN